ncbi:MAG: hypothetical protein RXO23_07805, partial [Vulcanisaeta sp.]
MRGLGETVEKETADQPPSPERRLVVKEVGRILKPGGKLLIIEFKKDVLFGPPFKLSPEEVEKYFTREGFVREQVLEVSPY